MTVGKENAVCFRVCKVVWKWEYRVPSKVMLETLCAFETVVSIYMFVRRYAGYVVPVASCTSVLEVLGSNVG